MQYVFTKNDATHFEKSGVSMWRFGGSEKQPNKLIYQEVIKGHEEEFENTKSTFIYFILEGKGTYVIADVEYPVVAGDVIMIPPHTPFYYKGTMKQILMNTPQWEEGTDKHIRNIFL